MAETFDRAQEFCANPFDQGAGQQLTDLMRQEFLNAPAAARTVGNHVENFPDSHLQIGTSFDEQGKVDPSVGMLALVTCGDKSQGNSVILRTDASGSPKTYDVFKNFNNTEHYSVLDIHGKK